MATMLITIQPFEIPEFVRINVPGQDTSEVLVDELNEETLAILVDEFATAVMAKAKK